MEPTKRTPTNGQLAEQRDGEAARRRRDRQLTMSERLQRVHDLCSQLARLRLVPSKRSR